MAKPSMTDQCRAALRKRLKREPTAAELKEALPIYKATWKRTGAVIDAALKARKAAPKRGQKRG